MLFVPALVPLPLIIPLLMAGLLTAVGVTEIYRLEPKYAFRQGFWVIAALALFAIVLVVSLVVVPLLFLTTISRIKVLPLC